MNEFAFELADDHVVLRMVEISRGLISKKRKILPLSEWSSGGNTAALRGLAAVGSVLQDVSDTDADHITLSHDFISNLSDVEARALGLPPSIPYQLRIWSTGNLVDNSYELHSEFIDAGEPIYIDRSIGAIFMVGRLQYRVPEPLFGLINEVRSFSGSKDNKIEAQARIAELLGEKNSAASNVLSENHLANIRIRHVSAISASVSGSLDDPQITPVLFARYVVQAAEEGGELLDETQQILDGSQLRSFNQQFLRDESANSTYVLSTGEYIYIDPSARPALNAFHGICKADKERRNAFIRAPNAVLAQALSEETDVAEELVASVFVETAQFSDRVLGINSWVVPDLPWLANETNDWGVNVLVFEQPGNAGLVMLPRDHLSNAIEAIETGLASGLAIVNVGDLNVPVSKDLLEAMRSFMPAIADKAEEAEEGSDIDGDLESDVSCEETSGPFVVETIDDFTAINYVRALVPPDRKINFVTPRALKPSTKLMKHQLHGLNWITNAYNIGLPGVLIADDMGLGKTLQALVFLAIYRDQIPQQNRQPCLVVAPTGLLNNWLEEIETHLGEAGLGQITAAYDRHLKALKVGTSGRDTDVGVPLLNISKLNSSNVVLTTYETLRDYQISFAQVAFGIVIFDEIQKTKNPRSLMSRSAAAVNGQFKIGLSGTPVENSLSDLWTIMDVLAPGLLKLSLREFMSEYGGSIEDPEILERLRALQVELLEPSENFIPPVLRRLKSDVFNAGEMPKKILHPANSSCAVMPPEQAAAYKDRLEAAQKGQIKPIQALQQFKRISLTPRNFENWLENPNEFIGSSGRLTEFFRILDEIHSRSEKVLVFVESLDLQPILAQFLKERYDLPKLPLVINGSISGANRQKAVNDFQSRGAGFDVMLISPKAGGVGLTLTAANNVVHLERWWNPAVEDQCNDRAYRIGQKRDVNIYTPITTHPVAEIPSFDLVLDSILNKKRGLSESLFIPSEVSTEDFSDIFEGTSEDISSKFHPISLEESYELESGINFEEYVGQALHAAGFTVSQTNRSWDFGCDLVAKKGANTILVQVKQVQSDKILDRGVDDIIKAQERYKSYNPTALALITNAIRINSSQTELAKRNNVVVLTGKDISRFGESLSLTLKH